VVGTAAAVIAVSAVSGLSAATGDVARAGGVQLTLPDGWTKVVPARETRSGDPRTLLVIGTDGVKAIETDCQVASYRIPSDGAIVVVLGWRDSVGSSLFPMSAMKLRRGTFECFAGRGAVGRLTRRDRDFQINVMVGDHADTGTVADAFEAARTLGLVPRA
jgi:hypothetical protein